VALAALAAATPVRAGTEAILAPPVSASVIAFAVIGSGRKRNHR
jgi:hypothetical protein